MGGDFSGANLAEANCEDANFIGAKLTEVNFTRANLSGANLAGVNLTKANLTRANLDGAILRGANVTRTLAQRTIFAAIDLRDVQGLELMYHLTPSTIGINTIYLSGGYIPDLFLRGCGVPDSMIEYARALVVAERPIDYHSCFISYSSADEALARRLHDDLQAAGVRCWYAPEDLKIGESIIDSIDQSIRLHEKLLLILFEAAVASSWVALEVKTAIMREQRENCRVLFPIRLEDAVMQSGAGWAAQVQERQIGDFRQWTDYAAYQQAFTRLLRDLRAG